MLYWPAVHPLPMPEPETHIEPTVAEKRSLATRTFSQVKLYADRIKGSIWRVSMVYLLAGVWLWGQMYWPFAFGAWWHVVIALLAAVVLLLPGAVIVLFYVGLKALADIPTILQDSYEAGKTETKTAGQAANIRNELPHRVRIPTLLRSLWNLRGIVMGSKEMMIGYVALFRMVNLVTLIVTAAAFVIGLLETFIALLTIPLRFL